MKELTKDEQAKVLAFRKQGLSLKAIGKKMHIGDKRIGAFLKSVKDIKAKPVTKEAGKAKSSPKAKAKETTAQKKCGKEGCDNCNWNKKATLTWADITSETDVAVGKYIGGLFDSIFQSMSDIFQDKDVSREEFIQQLEQISDNFLNAVAGVCIELLVSMPPMLRVAWVKGKPFYKGTK